MLHKETQRNDQFWLKGASLLLPSKEVKITSTFNVPLQDLSLIKGHMNGRQPLSDAWFLHKFLKLLPLIIDAICMKVEEDILMELAQQDSTWQQVATCPA